MTLKEMTIENYRNIQSLSLSFGDELNIICGENAQGKTNLIEAIWLFSGMRSFRGAKDGELVSFSAEFCRLTAKFLEGEREQEAQIVLGQKKAVAKNGVKCEGASELCGVFPMVVFSPVHLSLIKDGPALRRRFLDAAIGQLYPSYREALHYYNRALIQRNALLRDVREHAFLLDTLDIWDQNLAKAGAQIIRLRQRYVARMQDTAREVYSGIAAKREALCLSYESSLGDIGQESEITALREQFLQMLRKNRAEDIRQCATTIGAHRDDLSVQIDQNSARLYGSQGQQRSCVLALKLAECAIIEETLGLSPIILLDDVMSELDKNRRSYLYRRIVGKQVFITCCEEEHLLDKSEQKNKQAKLFFIKAGALQE